MPMMVKLLVSLEAGSTIDITEIENGKTQWFL
ncbi:MAG: hypothetical protein CM15mP86_17680 [Gammaproteobacteria bacterium]|nr:MAG: hypothetical protein CM15mP86_17680 [Gammaproteobacteria bacterium]